MCAKTLVWLCPDRVGYVHGDLSLAVCGLRWLCAQVDLKDCKGFCELLMNKDMF